MGYTKSTKLQDIKRNWHAVDVKGKILGRVSTQIASYLIGKGKFYYVPYMDCGDFVVVTNAAYVSVTGKKPLQKIYMRFSGYPAGLKKKTYAEVLRTHPERIILESVSGMLPKNKLRDSMLKRLYVFPGQEHPYTDKFKVQS